MGFGAGVAIADAMYMLQQALKPWSAPPAGMTTPARDLSNEAARDVVLHPAAHGEHAFLNALDMHFQIGKT